MTIYLDNCCYNRPFDDQTQERIYLESEVILTVLKMGQAKKVIIAGSEILDLEIHQMQDEIKKRKVLDLYKVVDKHILYTEIIKKRSANIMSVSNIRTFDSLHIAAAEAANAGIKVLQEALGPVGMVKFLQQYDMGYGDYTKEKQEQPDISLDEIDKLLKKSMS